MTEYSMLDKETLLSWMKFHYNGRISEVISLINYYELSIKERIEKCNEEFIEFAYKITRLMNDKLNRYYEQAYEEIFQNSINEEDTYNDEIDSDDPLDYLPKNPTIADYLQIYFSFNSEMYSPFEISNIFDRFNTDFLGLTEGRNVLKIYSNIFLMEIYKLPDAIDIRIIPSDMDWSKYAINNYFDLFKNNKLINENGNIRTYISAIKRFYTFLKESEYVLSNFYYEGDEHLHALFSLVADGLVKINSFKNDGIFIDAQDFINYYNYDVKNDTLNIKPTVDKINDTDNIKDIKARINRLKDLDKIVISARAYLEETQVDRVTYKKIADFLTDNNIYHTNENSIKQKVYWIQTKLGVQDLTGAVYLLKEANALMTYEELIFYKALSN